MARQGVRPMVAAAVAAFGSAVFAAPAAAAPPAWYDEGKSYLLSLAPGSCVSEGDPATLLKTVCQPGPVTIEPFLAVGAYCDSDETPEGGRYWCGFGLDILPGGNFGGYGAPPYGSRRFGQCNGGLATLGGAEFRQPYTGSVNFPYTTQVHPTIAACMQYLLDMLPPPGPAAEPPLTGPSVDPPPSAQPPSSPGQAPPAAAKLSGAVKVGSLPALGRALAKGIKVRFACTRSTGVRATLTVSRSVAKRAGLGSREIAGTSGRCKPSGSALALRFTKQARRRLAGLAALTARLTVTAKSGSSKARLIKLRAAGR